MRYLLLLVLAILSGCMDAPSEYTKEPEFCLLPVSPESTGDYVAPRTSQPVTIDGEEQEDAWETATWKDIKYNWLGEEYSEQDFQGRYKILWDSTQLYFLVEVVDDVLSDVREDPFDDWWEDDGVEIFIDEDKSGGNHQFSHNAFAYHILLNGDVVDMGQDEQPHLYNEHIDVKRTKDGNLYIWEIAMRVYDSSYTDDAETNEPVTLYPGKVLGYGVAYNDSDESGNRENFIGSIDIEPTEAEGKNRGWIDAGVFGELELVK